MTAPSIKIVLDLSLWPANERTPQEIADDLLFFLFEEFNRPGISVDAVEVEP